MNPKIVEHAGPPPNPLGGISVLELEPSRPGVARRFFGRIARGVRATGWGIYWLVERVIGNLSVVLALALLAPVPVVQLATLGYLLSLEGEIGKSGGLFRLLPGWRTAGRIGGSLLGIWLVVLPVRLLGDALADSRLIDPTSPATLLLQGLVVLLALLAAGHVAVAIYRGGRLFYFLWPVSNLLWLWRKFRGRQGIESPLYLPSTGEAYRELRRIISLGFRGFVGTAIWLFPASTLLAIGRGRPVLGVVGGLLLVVSVFYLPFLQVHFAAVNRFRAMFDIKGVRRRFQRAPLAFLVTFAFTLTLALPLYLLKVELPPKDIVWVLAVVFVVTILPFRMLAGWSYHRGGRREQPAWWPMRWGARMAMVPIAVLYVYIVFLTQYTSWRGVLSVYEHHAFLLPSPFSLYVLR